jgi:mannose-6-phosphate isomerase-like protein (cupin superfamily)
MKKPWGFETVWVKTDKYVGKLLHIDKGEALSLQYHKLKDEAWFVIKGKAEIKIGKLRKIMKPGDNIHIKPMTIHRIMGIETTEIIEVSTTELDDVVRIEDRYGRVK